MSNRVVVLLYVSLIAAAAQGLYVVHTSHGDGFKCLQAHKQSLGAFVIKRSPAALAYELLFIF